MAKPLNQEELEFVRAIEEYKKDNDKLFLSWTEVLGIAKKLGYSRPVQARTGSASSASSSKKKVTRKVAKKVNQESAPLS